MRLDDVLLMAVVNGATCPKKLKGEYSTVKGMGKTKVNRLLDGTEFFSPEELMAYAGIREEVYERLVKFNKQSFEHLKYYAENWTDLAATHLSSELMDISRILGRIAEDRPEFERYRGRVDSVSLDLRYLA